MTKTTLATALALALGGAAIAAPATGDLSAAERGRALFAERDRQDRGYGEQRVELRLTLRDPGGRTATRTLTLAEREGPDGAGDKSLIALTAPPDLAGTALLTQEGPAAGSDGQWLYLPSDKRTRRIAAADRSGRFVQTELSYEDLAGDPVDDFTYRWVRDEPVQGRPASLVERIPKDPQSQYSRQETWVDAQTKQVLKAQLYDRKGRHLKTLEASDWRQYQGRRWRPHRVVVTHVPSGRSTQIEAQGYRFGAGGRPDAFEPAALGR